MDVADAAQWVVDGVASGVATMLLLGGTLFFFFAVFQGREPHERSSHSEGDE